MKELEYLEEKTGENPKAAIIWLHGLGADGYDFQPISQQLQLPPNCPVHFVFPHAPMQPVTINQGLVMNAWYDIRELNLHAPEDKQGIFDAMHALETLVSTKFSHLDASKILLAGFSQGGALTLHTALHGNVPIGGVIALSSYLPLRELTTEINESRLQNIEILMTHGTHDDILPYEIGKLSKDVLLNVGANLDWREYSMGHQLCEPQIQDIRDWLLQRLC